MGTPYEKIYQKFVQKIADPDLINLPDATFDNVMLNYLDTACTYFTKCNQDLSQRDDNSKEFLITLTPFEIEILATKIVSLWLEPQINKITLLKQVLTDGDFKIHSQANHLKELTSLRKVNEAEFDKLIVQYTYDFGTSDTWNSLGSGKVLS